MLKFIHATHIRIYVYMMLGTVLYMYIKYIYRQLLWHSQDQ